MTRQFNGHSAFLRLLGLISVKAGSGISLAPPNLHVAVLVSGSSHNEFGDPNFLASNLAFFYSQLGPNYSTVLCLGKRDHTSKDERKMRIIDQANQYYRMESCYSTACQLEEQKNLTFTHFIRIRPDFEWFSPMTPFSALPGDSVAVRARIAMFQPQRLLSDDYFSWQRNFCCLGKEIPNSTEFDIRQCALLDDQLLVVPAQLADAAFLRNRDVILPTTKASQESYGVDRAVYLESCREVFKVH